MWYGCVIPNGMTYMNQVIEVRDRAVERVNSVINKTLDFSLVVSGLVMSIVIWKVFVEPALEKHSELLSTNLRLHREIYILLSEMRVLTKADRVILIQCEYTTASGVYKMNPTHEVTGPGIAYVSSSLEPIKDFCSVLMMNSMEKNPFHKRDVGDISTEQLKRLLISMGVDYTISILLQQEGRPVGVLVFHYCEGQRELFQSMNDSLIAGPLTKLTHNLSNRKKGILGGAVWLFKQFSPF